ncbi:MAG: hypothetical protein H3C35_02745 [Bacteroidetes bacterium]|nr:hypothetical protein [Bacteroidota bacterium]
MNFRLPYSSIITSGSNYLIALLFLVTWTHPNTLGNDMLNSLSVIIFMEFIIIHSAAFMTVVFFLDKPPLTKLAAFFGLGIFYSIFVIAYSVSYGEWWPLWSFWLLIINRLIAMFSGKKDENFITSAVAVWASSVFAYIIGIFAFLLLPVPEFGITEEARKQFTASTLWFSDPASLLAFGVFYYFCVGTAQFFILKKKKILELPV